MNRQVPRTRSRCSAVARALRHCRVAALMLVGWIGVDCTFERSPLWSPQAGAESQAAAGPDTGVQPQRAQAGTSSQRGDAGVLIGTSAGRPDAAPSTQPSAAADAGSAQVPVVQ